MSLHYYIYSPTSIIVIENIKRNEISMVLAVKAKVLIVWYQKAKVLIVLVSKRYSIDSIGVKKLKY